MCSDCLDPTHSTSAPIQYEGRVELQGVIFPPVEPVQSHEPLSPLDDPNHPLVTTLPPKAHAGAGYLYRHFAADGTKLYVGKSKTSHVRTRQLDHRASAWAHMIATVEFVVFDTEAAAKAAEDAELIAAPGVYNKNGTKAKKAKKVPKYSQEELQRLVDELADAELTGLNHQFRDLRGMTFGRLTVLALHPVRASDGKARWICRCECFGTLVVVLGGHLSGGQTSSCGCAQREAAAQSNTTHGLSRTQGGNVSPLYKILQHIEDRCHNPRNSMYRIYGAAGITLHEGWRIKLHPVEAPRRFFDYIAEHLGERPSPQHSLDRIDNSRGYGPGNIRWANKKRQQHNQDRAVSVWHEGRSEYIHSSDYAVAIGVSYSSVRSRIWLGTITDTITGAEVVAARATRLRREAIMIAEGIEVETDEMARENGCDVIHPREKPVQHWRALKLSKVRRVWDAANANDNSEAADAKRAA